MAAAKANEEMLKRMQGLSKELELLHCKEPGQKVGPGPGPTGRPTDRSG